jgi:Intracellular proteinase inhibitor
MMKRFLLCAAALFAASACSSDSTAPQLSSQTDAALAAATFAHMADSVSRSGGDADVSNAYSAIAGAVRAGGRVAPVTLTIDGTPASFVGTVVVTEISQGVYCVRAPCPPISQTIRNLIAWDKDNPKRVVQLSSTTDDEQIAVLTNPNMLASYAPMALLTYVDGKGGTYFGTSGTQKFAELNTKALCPAPPAPTGKDSAVAGITRNGIGVCTLTDAEVTFSAKVEPSPFMLTNNSASGTHTIAMAKQSVPGAHTLLSFPSCDTACTGTPNSPPPKVPTPPVVVRPSDELPAQLSAAVSSNLVTLTLTVKNPSAAPVDVKFLSGQKYDFVVIDSLTGKEAWRWSAGKGFTQTVGTQPIPANGALTFTETWTPPAKGLYLAHGVLVSASHRAEAYASVVVR